MNGYAYIGNYVVGKNRQKETFNRITPDGAKRNKGPGGRLAKSEKGKEHEQVRGDDWWEPIIDPALFLNVQEKLQGNTRTKRKPKDAGYPLTGILVCGHCGTNLFGETKTLKSGRSIRYLCGRFKNNPGCDCQGWKVDQDEVIHIAFDRVMYFTHPDKIIELSSKGKPKGDPLASRQMLRDQIEAQIERGNRRICKIEDDRMAKGVFAELERLYAERDRIDAEIQSIRHPKHVPKKITDWRKRYQDAMSEYLKEVDAPDANTVVLPSLPALTDYGEPLVLRQLFMEIGLRIICFWEQREHRTRAGLYRLDRVKIECDFQQLVTGKGWSVRPFDDKRVIDTQSGRTPPTLR